MSARDVVLVTVDSLRADRVGWHGYPRDTTPNLDELATESAVFRTAFAHACNTPYSFPAIMGSTYPSTHGSTKSFPRDHTPLAAILQSAGYATAGFHSNPYLREDSGYGRGFDTYSDPLENKSLLARTRQWIKGNINGKLRSLAQAAFDASERHVGFEPGSPFVPADELTDRAIRWAKSEPNAPRFLWLHYMDVHHPYEPPETHQRPFRDTPINQRTAVKLRRKMLEQPGAISSRELQLITDLYDAEIRFMDAEVGRLIETLRSMWDDPLVCFTADHGEELGDHGGFSHHMPKFFDEYLHVPLLIHNGHTQREYSELVGLLDVAPTILDYCNCRIPESYRGHSLHTLNDGDEWHRDGIIAEWGSPVNLNVCVRTTEWKFIHRRELPGYDWEWDQTELYNLTTDPGESENVIEDHPRISDELSAIVDDHLEQTAEPSHDVEPDEMEADVKDRLRQLGYHE